MTLPLQFDIPYRASALDLYAPVAGEPWAMLLDSHAGQAHPLARFDIVVADPITTLVTRGGITEIERHGDPSRAPALDLAQGDPFSLLRRELGRAGSGAAATCADLPFAGGALGYLGYDLARRIERLPSIAEDDRNWPQLALGIYRWAALTDHAARRSMLAIADPGAMDAEAIDRLRGLFSGPPAVVADPEHGPALIEGIVSNMTESGYRDRFDRVARYIHDGHVYQVNLAQRFTAAYEGDPLALYRRLRARSSGPCSAFLDLPFGQVLSVSPERFLQVRAGRVETRPIKGTRPRHADPAADAAAVAELAASGKDRAENVMIVDLLRNDLGRCCRTGSVSVPRLFAVESFASVHHLVSTVTGELDEARDVVDLVRGAFPGGSITGAPKLRAMQIIEELEPHRRGVYCGSIGYIGFDGAADLNIAIRTGMLRDGQVDFWAGGGIVADSDAGLEYAETLAKAAGFLSLAQS
jgi:para-aminobenzoate synthetase component 1